MPLKLISLHSVSYILQDLRSYFVLLDVTLSKHLLVLQPGILKSVHLFFAVPSVHQESDEKLIHLELFESFPTTY